tara:strand:+ start:272 stop:616 length:345 start_codon:yes stop_codon:yes gene_type:complete
MSKFSDFAHLGTTSHETGTTVPPVAPTPPEPVAPPVVEETPPTPPEYENPLDDMPVASASEVPPASTVFSTDDLDYKTKYELEQIGRTVGIELDRRLSHHKLVKQLKEHIENTQ